MLATLLFGSILIWQQTFRAQEFDPRAVQSCLLYTSDAADD